MIKILVVAYLMQGNPIIKPIYIPADIVHSTMHQDTRYSDGKVMNCLVILNKDYKGKNLYESPEKCSVINDRVNDELWEKKK